MTSRLIPFTPPTRESGILGRRKSWKRSDRVTGILKSKTFLVAVLISLSLAVIFYNLGRSSFHNGDEAVHALTVKEILRTGDWLTLRIEGEDFFNKPPLIIWLEAIAALIFGFSEFSIRLPSALCGLLTVVFTFLFAERLFDRRSALIAALIMLTCSQFIYVHSSRTGEFDSAITLFILLSVYFAWKSREKAYYLYLSFGCAGLVAMTKNIVAAIPVVILFAYLVISRRTRKFALGQIAAGFAVFLAIAVPWHAAQFFMHGKPFLDLYILDQVVGRRVGIGAPLAITNPAFFVDVVFRGFYPWSIITPFALLYAFANRKKAGAGNAALLIIWIFVVLLVCNSITSKFESIIVQTWYILPIYPALAIINGKLLADFAGYDHRTNRFLCIGTAMIVCLLFTLRPEFDYNPFVQQSFKSLMEIRFSPMLLRLFGKSKILLLSALVIGASIPGYGIYAASRKIPRINDFLHVISKTLLACVLLFSLTLIGLPLRFSGHESEFHKMNRQIWSLSGPEAGLIFYGNDLPGYQDAIYLHDFEHPKRDSYASIGLDQNVLLHEFSRNDRVFFMEKQHYYDLRIHDRFSGITPRPVIEWEKYVLLGGNARHGESEQGSVSIIDELGKTGGADPAVRIQAARDLGRIGDAGAVPSLLLLLKDKDDGVVSSAAKALSDLRARSAIGALRARLAQLGEKDPLYHAISLSLAYLRDRNSIGYLVDKYREDPIYPTGGVETSNPPEFASHDPVWTAYLLWGMDPEIASHTILDNLISFYRNEKTAGSMYNRMLYQIYRIDNTIALQLIERLLREGNGFEKRIAIALLAKPPGVITKMTEQEMDEAQALLRLASTEERYSEVKGYAADVLSKYHRNAWVGW